MELNSDQVLDALNEIAAVSSRNEKQALVTKYAKESSLFVHVLKTAYDPFINFGILPAKDAKGTGALCFGESGTYNGRPASFVFDLLDALQMRVLTGNAARNALNDILSKLNEKSGDLLIRILRKDLRAGFSESTCNKAVKGLIPEFPYMRCCLPKDAKLEKFRWDIGVLSQEKADGMFANANVRKSGEEPITFELLSRQGSVFPMKEFAKLTEQAIKTLSPEFQYHGELLVERNGVVLARELSNGILNSVLKHGVFGENERPIYYIWDAIPMANITPKGKYDEPYIKRFAHVIKQTNADSMIRHIPTRICRSLAECYTHYRDMLSRGKEGTVIKNPNATWRDGTSKEQVKLKLEADCELEVKGIVSGAVGGKNESRAGSLTCESSCGNLRVDVAVKNEAMRDAVDADHHDWIGRIITVRSNAILKPSASNDMHSMFLPRMVEACYRTDKTEADCLERITAQFDNAMKAV